MHNAVLPDNLRTIKYNVEDEPVKEKASTTGKKENKVYFYCYFKLICY